jgi:single-strand DNA-binding protein
VEGKIQSRDWTDRQGVSRKTVEIMVDNMELLSPKPTGQPASQPAAQPETPAAVAPSDNNGIYPF